LFLVNVLLVVLQVPCEMLMHQLQRNQTVADGLLQLVALKDVDTLVCGISGYR